MRFWIYLIFIICLLGGGALLSLFFFDDTVYIEYGDWSISPPLSLLLFSAVLVAVVAVLLLRLILAVFLFPVYLRRWNRRQRWNREHRWMFEALRAAGCRERRQLLRTLSKLAPVSHEAALRAAQVAEELGDRQANRKWLQQAAGSSDKAIAAAAKVDLCRQSGRLLEAENILREAGAPQSSALLAELMYAINLKGENYEAALLAALHLREEAPALWGEAVSDVILAKMNSAETAAAVADFWKNSVPSAERKTLPLLVAYIAALWRTGDEKTAGEELLQVSKRFPNDIRVLGLVADMGTKELCETIFRANDPVSATAAPELLLALGKIAVRLRLPGKARHYYQRLNALTPDPNYRAILAQLDEEVGAA